MQTDYVVKTSKTSKTRNTGATSQALQFVGRALSDAVGNRKGEAVRNP